MNDEEIIVVTGMARSGTTCMMRMLEAGGIPLYYDKSKPFEFKENGREYINYNIILRESDKVKQLADLDGSWLEECRGMAVKILTPTKTFIPRGYPYRFIYMDRKIKHMVNSQLKYQMRSQGRKLPMHDLILERVKEMRREGLGLLRNYPKSELIVIKFEEMLAIPKAVAIRIASFLDKALDIESMINIVVPRPAYCLNGMLEEDIYRE